MRDSGLCHANWKSPPRPDNGELRRAVLPAAAEDNNVAPSETLPTASAIGTVSFNSEAVARGANSFSRVWSPAVAKGTSIVSVISCCVSGLPRIQQT